MVFVVFVFFCLTVFAVLFCVCCLKNTFRMVFLNVFLKCFFVLPDLRLVSPFGDEKCVYIYISLYVYYNISKQINEYYIYILYIFLSYRLYFFQLRRKSKVWLGEGDLRSKNIVFGVINLTKTLV